MRLLSLCLLWTATAAAQAVDGRLLVDDPRPMHAVAGSLARYGVVVNVEDPPYLYSGDIKDVTAQISKVANPPNRVLVPLGGRIDVPFPARPDGSPRDARALLQSVVDQANAQFSFGYRLEETGDAFSLIPTRTRDKAGLSIEAVPLLGRLVTIPSGTRTGIETGSLLAAALAAQTGGHVNCCQSMGTGIPWGMHEVVTLEARNEPARDVLRRLVQSSSGRYRWSVSCDPFETWCFIHLAPVY